MIPVFNRKHFIAECIQSALDQTYENYEIVIVDNASNDGTWEICLKFAKDNSRVKVFQNETNIGPVRNWLRCLDVSQGEYGKFLFSDDLMMPTFLDETIKYLSDSSIAFVSTAALIGNNLKTSSICYVSADLNERISKKSYFDGLATQGRAIPYSPGTAIFRMKDLKNNLTYQINSAKSHDFALNGAGPDVLLLALTAMQYKTVYMVSKPLVFLRVHADSFTFTDEDNSVTEGYRIALAWFFRRHVSMDHWASWVAKIWIYEVIHRRSLKSPGYFIGRYEGRVGIKESIRVIRMALKIIYRKIKGNLNSTIV